MIEIDPLRVSLAPNKKHMGKFTLQKAVAAGKKVEKRPLEEVVPQPRAASKFIKVSQVIEEDAPKAPMSMRKLSANAPVEVIIYKYTDSRPASVFYSTVCVGGTVLKKC